MLLSAYQRKHRIAHLPLMLNHSVTSAIRFWRTSRERRGQTLSNSRSGACFAPIPSRAFLDRWMGSGYSPHRQLGVAAGLSKRLTLTTDRPSKAAPAADESHSGHAAVFLSSPFFSEALQPALTVAEKIWKRPEYD